jgi:hypothetical protein
MVLRLAKLIWLPCCILILMFASLPGTRASSCLSSAEAVKDTYPLTRPHWRMWPHNGGGAKCWHPGTRAGTHRRRSRTLHHRNLTAVPKPVVTSVDSPSNPGLAAARGETSGTGLSLQVPVAPASPATAAGQSSFADRFAAVFEVILFERPSVVRRMEGALPRTP